MYGFFALKWIAFVLCGCINGGQGRRSFSKGKILHIAVAKRRSKY